MRIRDWSSDVCSSDLKTLLANVSGLMATAEQARETVGTQRTLAMEDPVLDMDVADLFDGLRNTEQPLDVGFESHLRDLLDNPMLQLDRKSVVQGKSVSVRVDLGGSRYIKKKKN